MRYYEFKHILLEYNTQATVQKLGNKIVQKLDLKSFANHLGDLPAAGDDDSELRNFFRSAPNSDESRAIIWKSTLNDYQVTALHILHPYVYNRLMDHGTSDNQALNVLDGSMNKAIEGYVNQAISELQDQIATALISILEQFDPTQSKKYTLQIIKWYISSNEFGTGNFPNIEDGRATFADGLGKFERMKARLPVDKRDIRQYPTAVAFSRWAQLLHKEYGKPAKLGKGDAQILYKDDVMTVYWPKDEAAACYYGQGTQWCTASTESTNYFDEYSKPFEGQSILIFNFTPPIKVDVSCQYCGGEIVKKLTYRDGTTRDDLEKYGFKECDSCGEPDNQATEVNKLQLVVYAVTPEGNKGVEWAYSNIMDPQDEEMDLPQEIADRHKELVTAYNTYLPHYADDNPENGAEEDLYGEYD